VTARSPRRSASKGRHARSSTHGIDINGLTCLDAGDKVALEQQRLAPDAAYQAGDRRLDLRAELAIEAIADVPNEVSSLEPAADLQIGDEQPNRVSHDANRLLHTEIMHIFFRLLHHRRTL
jgi:hypothetical protein